MLKNEIVIGGLYKMKVSNKIATVRIVSENRYGGWNGTNVATNRSVRIRSAGKLRGKVSTPEVKPTPKGATAKRYTKATREAMTPSMDVVICGPNLRDQSKGTFHVHAAGCSDLKRMARNEPEYRNGWKVAVNDVKSVIVDVYADQMREADEESQQDWESYVDDFHFFPCCDSLPHDADEATKAKVAEVKSTTSDEFKSAMSDAMDLLNEYAGTLDTDDDAESHTLDRILKVTEVMHGHFKW